MPIDLWQVALPWAALLTARRQRAGRGDTQRTDRFQTELAVAIACLLLLSEVLIPWLTIWKTAPHDA